MVVASGLCGFDLRDVNQTAARINVYEQRDMLTFVALQRLGIVDTITLLVFVVDDSLAVPTGLIAVFPYCHPVVSVESLRELAARS